MRNIELLKENIIDLIDDEIESELKARLLALIDSDSECKSFYQSFLASYRAVKDDPVPQVSSSFYARLNQRVEQYEAEKIALGDFWELFTGKARPILASLSLIVAIAAGYFMGSGLTNGTLMANGTDEYDLADYYGIEQFDLSAELTLPEIYNDILPEEVSNE